MGKEMLAQRPVPLSEVKVILSEREKEGELGFEQKGALDYASKFSHLSPEKTKEMMDKLTELDFVSEAMAVKLVDILPKTPEEVKVIFMQERRELTEGQVKQILEVLSGLGE